MIEANTINNMDCLDGLAQMPDGCAKLIVADPPYFMGLTHNGQRGQFNDLAVAKPFYRQMAQQLRRILNDHGEFYIFMDWRGCAFYYPIFAEYLPVKNMIVWDKMSGPGNFYNSSHEFILYGCIDPQTKKTRPQRLDRARLYLRQHTDRRRENTPVTKADSTNSTNYHGRQRAGRSCGRPVRGQLHNRRGLYQNGPPLCVL